MKRTDKHAQTFAERLRELLTTSGMTQGEIARRANVSPQVVSRLLAVGNADVTLSVACRLAWAMGKSVREFEEVVFEEWKMQPETLEGSNREMARGRLRQKLTATETRIAEWENMLPTCGKDHAEQMTRRWMEGLIGHWKKKAQDLNDRLQQLDLDKGSREETGAR